ncbi:hypothetical protein NQZ68_039538 [Dissostichus eleginoides]|nr:hypothetical protein NQZ68_039538 [Dissostichus eleginoides]
MNKGKTVGCELWAASCGQRAVGCELRAVGSELWAASCGLRAVGSELWAASCGLRAVGCELWAASCGLRAVGCELWAAGCKLLPATVGRSRTKEALRAERREIEYPAKCKSVNAKDKHKEKTLCGNPEVLFTDYAQQKEGRKKNNLIFFTDSIYIWKDTLCSNYAYVSREGIGSGGRLNICKDEHLDKDDPLLTITYYTKGKVMVQGKEANLESFEEAFPC